MRIPSLRHRPSRLGRCPCQLEWPRECQAVRGRLQKAFRVVCFCQSIICARLNKIIWNKKESRKKAIVITIMQHSSLPTSALSPTTSGSKSICVLFPSVPLAWATSPSPIWMRQRIPSATVIVNLVHSVCRTMRELTDNNGFESWKPLTKSASTIKN